MVDEAPPAAREGASAAGAGAPLEDGFNRCAWVAGRPEHYAFHDAEYGAIPDTDDYCRERVILACFQRDVPLAEVLDRRNDLWTAMSGYDVKAMQGLDDAWISRTAGLGGIFADRARLAWVADVAKAVVATAGEWKELRNYFLDERFLPVEEQFVELSSRFPGFAKPDAANLMALVGTLEGTAHDRDCWRS